MKTRILSLLPLVVYFAISSAINGQEEIRLAIPDGFTRPGQLFVVKNTADTVDAMPGDGLCADVKGNCTLRAAVEEANANEAANDIIIFQLEYPAVIELTLGTLNLTEIRTSIVGPGARKLTIRRASAAAPFRILNVTSLGNRLGLRGARIEGGSASESGYGGALRIEAGTTADLSDVWITGNTAASGGAIANNGTLIVSRSLVAGNQAGSQGGGLYLAEGSTSQITNSTITGNSAGTGGGVYASGSLISVNNTISHNSAKLAASGIASMSGSEIKLLNTIVGADTSLPITTISGAFTSLGNNVVTDARSATGFTNGVNNDQVSDNNAIDLHLGPLSDHGGQTDTRALLTNSPAIDRGNSCVLLAQDSCPGLEFPSLRFFWDQRVPYGRVSGPEVDVGAVESGSTASRNSNGFVGLSFSGRIIRSGFAIAINTSTGERRTATVNMLGAFRFTRLDLADVYVLETHIKNMQMSPMIFPRGL